MINTKKFLIGLFVFAIVFAFPSMASAALTVGSTSITSDGNINLQGDYVGISTETPEHPLHFTGTQVYLDSGVGSNTSMDLAFRHYRVSGTREWSIGPATGSSTTAFSFNYDTGGIDDILTFSATGNVGMGTSAPADQLHVNSTTGDENYIRITNTASVVSGFYLGAEQVNATILNSEAGDMWFGNNNDIQMTLNNGGDLAIVGDTMNIATSKTPASAGAACTQGDIVWDTNFIYVCVATNTWKRSAIATW